MKSSGFVVTLVVKVAPTAFNVTDNCPATTPFISGDTAKLNRTETVKIISEGKPLHFSQFIQFRFNCTHKLTTDH